MRPASILERSSTSLMRRSRCRPLCWMSVSGTPEILGHVAVDLVEDHLVEAEDRVHRRAQLVAHVGEEVGLGLAGPLELGVEPELAGSRCSS